MDFEQQADVYRLRMPNPHAARVRGAMDLLIDQLQRLPRHPDEIWQGAVVRMATWITGEGSEPYRPRAAVWIAVKAGTMSRPDICRPDEMNLGRVLGGLVGFATDPELGGYLPERIEVRDPALAEHLQGALFTLGVEVACGNALPALDLAMAQMAEDLGGGPQVPGLLSGDSVTVEAARRFAEAAVAFYQAAPWKHLTDEDLIQIESPEGPTGLRFATVLGAGGQTFGLGFYNKPQECWDIRRIDDPAEWFSRRKRGLWHLTFNDITEIPVSDADLWEDHGLPVAGDRAYPCLMCYSPDGTVKRPSAAVLGFAESLLRALARSTEEHIDSGRWTVAVAMAGGPSQFTLALPDLLKPPTHQELMKRGFEPDRRTMEQMQAQMHRFLDGKDFKSMDEVNAAIQRELMGKPADPTRFPPRNALEEAQEFCHQAFDAIGRRQLQLARKALAVSPDCADAYVLLAERTSDPNEAAELFAKGVAAGERGLGMERFVKDAGHFWGIISTRPYMRACLGLAQSLEQLGREVEAVEHYRELLRLNPGDNQGVRYLYLPLAMKLGRDAEAARFMKESQDEESANWAYTRALLAYRVGGVSAPARMELRKALRINPYVVPSLLAEVSPEPLPASYSPGSREEAMICAAELRSVFAATPGAREWLEDEARRLRRERRKQEEERGKKKRR